MSIVDGGVHGMHVLPGCVVALGGGSVVLDLLCVMCQCLASNDSDWFWAVSSSIYQANL